MQSRFIFFLFNFGCYAYVINYYFSKHSVHKIRAVNVRRKSSLMKYRECATLLLYRYSVLSYSLKHGFLVCIFVGSPLRTKSAFRLGAHVQQHASRHVIARLLPTLSSGTFHTRGMSSDMREHVLENVHAHSRARASTCSRMCPC